VGGCALRREDAAQTAGVGFMHLSRMESSNQWAAHAGLSPVPRLGARAALSWTALGIILLVLTAWLRSAARPVAESV